MKQFTESDIKQWFTNINSKKILVIGDFMLDKYIHGKVDRISPEAPVPVVHVRNHESRAGGAGNVVVNVHALGAQVFPLSLIGNDDHGKELLSIFKKLDINTTGILQLDDLKTTTKTRVLAQSYQMLRIDDEDILQINEYHRDILLQKVATMLQNDTFHAILFEDYDKGVLNEKMIQQIIQWAHEKGIPTFVDPKKNNFCHYKKVTFFKPNLKELREGLDMQIGGLEDVLLADKMLRKQLMHTYTLCTMSEKGVYFSDANSHSVQSSFVRNLADVSGAGDSVIATLTCLYVAGAEPEIAAQIANIAAGIVCEYPGVVPVQKERLLLESTNYFTR